MPDSQPQRRDPGPGPGEVEVFYADPVDENGNKIATVKMTLTRSQGFDKVTVTKIPHDEIVLDEDTLHIRPWEKDADG